MNVSEDYLKACKEVLCILDNMEKSEVENIPLSFRNFIQEMTSKTNYVPNIKKEIPLKEQNLLPKTKALLGLIYRQYLCDEKEKEEFDKRLIENENKYQSFLDEIKADSPF